METDCIVEPFLKWPGGKRWLTQRYAHFLPKRFNCYFEPFLGGGSVFFYLKPDQAVLSDINADVVAVYKAIKDNWKFIKRSLEHHQRKHSEEHYYKMRDAQLKSSLQQASRILYLNRTCFNGIYRVNLKGNFNVPIGTKEKVILDTDNFEITADLLKNAEVKRCDFEKSIQKAKKQDFIFVDPPYTVRHNLNGFIKYNENLFSWKDQERLAACLYEAKKRGVIILSTNANHASIRDLYINKGFFLKVVTRFSPIAASGKDRKQFEELIISSYKIS